jgi:hypothetical protein
MVIKKNKEDQLVATASKKRRSTRRVSLLQKLRNNPKKTYLTLEQDFLRKDDPTESPDRDTAEREGVSEERIGSENPDLEETENESLLTVTSGTSRTWRTPTRANHEAVAIYQPEHRDIITDLTSKKIRELQHELRQRETNNLPRPASLRLCFGDEAGHRITQWVKRARYQYEDRPDILAQIPKDEAKWDQMDQDVLLQMLSELIDNTMEHPEQTCVAEAMWRISTLDVEEGQMYLGSAYGEWIAKVMHTLAQDYPRLKDGSTSTLAAMEKEDPKLRQLSQDTTRAIITRWRESRNKNIREFIEFLNTAKLFYKKKGVKSEFRKDMTLSEFLDLVFEVEVVTAKIYSELLYCAKAVKFRGKSARALVELVEKEPETNKKKQSSEQQSAAGGTRTEPTPGTKQKSKKTGDTVPTTCHMCGKQGHKHAECRFRDHPNANLEPGVPFVESKKGKDYIKYLEASWKDVLSTPARVCLWAPVSDGRFYHDGRVQSQMPERWAQRVQKKRKGKSIFLCALERSDAVISMKASSPSSHTTSTDINVLIDTGSQANILRTDVARRILGDQVGRGASNHHGVTIRSALSDVYNAEINDKCVIKLEYNNIPILVTVFVVNNLVDECILGLPMIKKCYEIWTLKNIFQAKWQFISDKTGTPTLLQPDSVQETATKKRSAPADKTPPTQPVSLLARAITTQDFKQLLNIDADTEKVSVEEPLFEKGYDLTVPEFQLSEIKVEGPESLQTRIRETLQEFKSVFANQVRAKPAMMTAMELEVNETWRVPSNQQPPRPQTVPKEASLREYIAEYLRLGVIKESRAKYWSQVLMVKKPDNTYRFCVDYRALNAASEPHHWPLPLIKQMCQRIGSRRPKYFAKMDMTAGYHQCPLAMASQPLTAFITPMGIYEWARVPMGLKGAPAHFQHGMSAEILAGLLYSGCEVYMDDAMVYGSTEEEFILNLRRVLERFRDRGITVKASKCSFGMSEIEYVGHIINAEGVSFSDEKLRTLFDTPKPRYLQQLKAFLGLANYYRDHILNYATLSAPLHDLLQSYSARSKRHLVQWTPTLEAIFTKVKEAIRKAPRLFFIDNQHEIILETDASDYGIGAHLYQEVDGEQRSIMILSKSLSKTQRQWSVADKEAYAMYFAMQTWDYLLRDVRFTWRTDHKNLTYFKESKSAKILRWRQHLAEFDFNTEFISGEANVLADSLSRVAAEVDEEEVTVAALSSSVAKLSAEIYKKIESAHNSVVGHMGVERTIQRLNDMGENWENRLPDVQSFIHQCAVCQKLQYGDGSVSTTPYTTGTYEPMATINVDSIGPLPADAKGYQHILVLIDCFSRWVELYPLKTTQAEESALAFLNHAGRFGFPADLRSDRGPQFANAIIQELVQLMGSKQIFSLSYSHQENGIVERANREIMRHLRAILYDQKHAKDWSDNLPFVQRIINSQIHRSTGTRPAEILFGTSINLDQQIFKKSPGVIEQDLSTWIQAKLECQQNIIKNAQEILQRTEAHQIANKLRKNASTKATTSGFQIGDLVLVTPVIEAGYTRPETKTNMILKGPMRVVHVKQDTYTIQHLTSGKQQVVHLKRLRPFQYDPEFVNPENESMKETGEYIVEKVVKCRGDRKGKRKDLEFLIHWQGYDNPKDYTWEPWSSAWARNSKMIEFLRANQMASLISKTVE